MSVTLATAIARVRNRIGEATASYWDDDEIIGYINDAKDDLQNAVNTINKDFFQKVASLSIVSGRDQYLLASDFTRLKSMVVTTDGYQQTMFIPISRNSPLFIAGRQNNAYTNMPYQYMYEVWQNVEPDATPAPAVPLHGWNISFSPSIKTAFTIEYTYIAFLPDLSALTDTFDFLDPFSGFIYDQAASYALSKGPAGDFITYERRAEKKLNRILAVCAKRTMTGPEVVAGFLEDTY